MANIQILDQPNGDKVVAVEVDAPRVSVVMHDNRDFNEVADKMLADMERQNTAAVLSDANERLKTEYQAGTANLPHPFDEAGIITWYMSLPDYETRWQKADREEAERKAAEQAAEAERLARLAEAEATAASAEDDLLA